jgi:sarcosine oxidase subunit alpha
MGGLGRLDPGWKRPPGGAPKHRRCDALIIGAGPAGLAAARAAAEAGLMTLVVDDRPAPGGSLLYRGGEIEGLFAAEWILATVAAIEAAGGALLANTTAYGVYDHNLVSAVQRNTPEGDVIWRIRPRQKIVLAAGAIERPLIFDQNDKPGVMLAEAGLAYLNQYGVLVGDRVAVATNNDSAYASALALKAAGADVTVIDARITPPLAETAAAAGIDVHKGERVLRAEGHSALRSVTLTGGAWLEVEALLVSGGFAPNAHLYSQAKGPLAWDEKLITFVPDGAVEGFRVVGAANGVFSLDAALADARAAVATLRGGVACEKKMARENTLAIAPAWPKPNFKGRAWIDLLADVTLKDIDVAARESYLSIEHAKRYTALGMAPDQGKTSRINGVAALAAVSGRKIAEVGGWTFRPPFTPVPMTALAGSRSGELMNPLRRLPLEARHRALGAVFDDFGGWLRPAFYGEIGAKDAAIARETLAARNNVAVFDASPLGKIEVIGPDAARFLDFQSYMTVSTLKPGRVRYMLLLQETGVVFDDGVIARLDETRFIVSCSTSHVAGVYSRLEDWRQDQFDPSRLYLHNATPHWATLTFAGPASRKLLERLDLGVDLGDAALPHMALALGRFAYEPARIARVSFSGERSYEVSVRASLAEALLERALKVGGDLGVSMLGLEALSVLRAEKGFFIVGKDSDGATMPHDLGFGAPRGKRADDFVGKRSLFTEVAIAPNRRQLVGLEALEAREPLPCGAHIVDLSGGKPRSQGYVTSSYMSPTLGRPIALGLVESGASRLGETVTLQHLGRRLLARIAPPCVFDPRGERLHA